MRVLEYPFNAEEIIKKKKVIKRELLSLPESFFLKKKIAILGGSTTHDIKNILELFLLNYGIQPCFYESEYNRYYEDAMFPNQILQEFAPDIIYFHTSNRNLLQYPSIMDTEQDIEWLLESTYERFERMWEHIRQEYHCPIIQNNFEPPFFRLLGNQDVSNVHGHRNFINRLNEKFYQYAQSHSNFFIHDIAYESAVYGLEKWSDPYYWYMYKYAMCVPAIPYTAFELAKIMKSIFGKNKKVLCLDLDNTLWGGIIGEEGEESIEIGAETSLGQTYQEFQMYLKSLKEMGVLLTVNSKNDPAVALKGLRHPDSILREEDFVKIKANWNPKDQNLFEIASEMHLLAESFVFVDDNPAEREIVRNRFPDVSIPEMVQPEHYINILDRSGFFEFTMFSHEDWKRNKMYIENAKRIEAQADFSNYQDYLKSLNMQASIKKFEPMYLSRISQLTNKTNQFNLTTKRYSQSEIEKIFEDKTRITLYGKLEDRFGDNGVVSVIVGKIRGKSLHIELWLMSCRVLKRDMEYAMMDELVRVCQNAGLENIYGYYYPTAKNNMVKDFYHAQGFDKISENPQETVWLYSIETPYQKKNKVIKINLFEKNSDS